MPSGEDGTTHLWHCGGRDCGKRGNGVGVLGQLGGGNDADLRRRRRRRWDEVGIIAQAERRPHYRMPQQHGIH